MGRLEGKVAIVTGSGRGIGRSVALAMAREGAKVVINDPGVNVDGTGFERGPADQVAEEVRALGGQAAANYDAVGTMQAGESLVKTALDAFGRVDILVNCAGILRDRMIFNMSEEEWDAVIQVHLKGTFACTRAVAPVFRQQKFGRIINFTSITGLIGNPGQANYGAAKGGIAAFTRVAARDLGRYAITCNAVAPLADTRMTAQVPGGAGAFGVPYGMVGADGLRDTDHVAPMVVYLCTDAAWNINGQVFAVSGGTISLVRPPVPHKLLWKTGMWTLDELEAQVPPIVADIPNPAPPPEDAAVPGRPRAEAQPA